MFITNNLLNRIKKVAAIPEGVNISILKSNNDFYNGLVFWYLVDGDKKIKQVRLNINDQL